MNGKGKAVNGERYVDTDGTPWCLKHGKDIDGRPCPGCVTHDAALAAAADATARLAFAIRRWEQALDDLAAAT